MAKKRFLTKLITMLLLVTILLPSFFTIAGATSAEAANKTTYVQKGVVTASNLNFRTEASISSKVIKVLPQGTTVIIIEEQGDWLKVEYEGDEGYLFKSYVEKLLARGITTATSLNVRSKPTVNSQSLALIYKGTKVSILEEIETDDESNPVWFKISYLNGATGYVSKRYVNVLTNPDGTYRNVGVTTAKLLNVRADATLFSKVITRLYEGSNVIILDSKETNDYYKKWYKVNYDGQVGWIAGKYLEEQEWTLAAKASTSSPSSGKNRNHNMSLACSTLTGTIVMPGEKFSWIETMGSCSAAKGFLTATVYVNGIVSEGAGGGVCQVSTTFNMAIKKLGISTKASKHSLPVSYAKREDEASVSYPYVDFSFTNTLEVPILVEFESNNGTVVCNIYKAE